MTKAKDILETANLDKSVWGKRIIAAEKRGEFTNFDQRMSRHWTTCACGKQDKRIPRRRVNKRPLDDRLSDLGVAFETHVCVDRYALAARVLIRIEARSAVVLAELDE